MNNMVFERVDLKSLIDAVTALVVALGVIYTAYKANRIHEAAKTVQTTANTIEKSVNGAASKAQEVINDLRRQLGREKEISQEKSQTAAVLQAASSGQHTIPQQQKEPIKAEIVNEESIPVKIENKEK